MSNAIIKQQGDSPRRRQHLGDSTRAGSFILGALAGTLVTCCRAAHVEGRSPQPPTPRGWPINFAHRGGAKVVPEDTIEGFREGFAMGAGVVECDVHASAEGTIVVIHDAVVDRTTDGTGPVAEKTVPELQRLDAGYRFSPGGLTFPWRAKGVKIPTLEALYEAFPDAPSISKSRVGVPASRRPCSARSKPPGRWNAPWLFQTIGARFHASAESSQGKVATASSRLSCWSTGSSTCCTRPLYDPPFQALQPPEKYKGVVPVVTRRFVRKAHDRGLRVDVWTIDDEPAMRRLLSLGVDGIMTDRPDVLARVLNSR